MATTPNMNLTLPTVSETPGPTWANNINESLNTVDEHNHAPGMGVPVPTAGLNIDADLPVNDKSVIDMNMAAFTNRTTDAHDHINGVYAKNGNLYWNNGSNIAVQITDGSSIVGGGGSGAPVVITQEVFVSKNGNDATADGSMSKPFLTITSALAHVSATFTALDYVRVNVGPGVYAENVVITRARTVIVGANANPEELTTQIAGYVTVNCSTASSKYQDIIGLNGLFVNCASANPAFKVTGTGIFLVAVNNCYLTTSTTDQYTVFCDNTNATRPAIYFRNSLITRYANSSTATVMHLYRGDVRIENVRLYASVTGTSRGIEIFNDATLTANSLLVETSTSNVGIYVAAATTATPLILSNSGVTCSYTGGSSAPALYLSNSLGPAALVYQSLLTVMTATGYAIGGSYNGSTPALYYAGMTYGGINSTNNIAAISVPLNGTVAAVTATSPITVSGGANPDIQLGVVPVAKGGTGMITPGTSGNVLTSNGTAWVSSAPSGLTRWTEAQASYSGKTIDSLAAVAAGANADAAVVAKGAGATLAQIPDGTIANGNVRGQYATDLQKSRTNAARVAVGDYSVVVGGTNNGANNSYSAIVGGENNLADSGNTHSFIGAGKANALYTGGAYSSIVGGTGNSMGGNGVNSAFIGGGENNVLTAEDSSTYATHSVIGGGFNNIIKNAYNGILGGYQNLIPTARYSSVSGGQSNAVYGGSHSGIGAGQGNYIESQWSNIAGGKENSVTKAVWYAASNNYTSIGGGYNNAIDGGTAATIPGGRHATSRTTMGRFAFASGSPEADPTAHRGATQMSIVVPFVDTGDATPIPLTANGAAASAGAGNVDYNILRLAPYSAVKIRAEVVARNKNIATSGVKAWTIEGLALMDASAGTATVTGVIATAFGAGLAGASVDLKADTILGGVYVEVTGLAATNIRWAATIYATEVVTF